MICHSFFYHKSPNHKENHVVNINFQWEFLVLTFTYILHYTNVYFVLQNEWCIVVNNLGE